MKMRKKRLIRLISLLIFVMLVNLACNLFSPNDVEEVIVEVTPIDEPEPTEAEPSFSPKLLFRLEPTLGDESRPIGAVAISNDGTMLGTGIFTRADFWDAKEGSLIKSIDVQHSIEAMAFTQDENSVLLSINMRGSRRYSLADGELELDYDDGGYDPSMTLSNDGEWLASGTRSNIIKLLQVSSGELLIEVDPGEFIEGYSEWGTSVAISPDRSILAAGHWDGSIFLWDTSDGTLIRSIEPETAYCSAWSLAFSNDGNYLALGGGKIDHDEVIKIYNVAAGEAVKILEEFGRGGARNAPVAFSPDGTMLAAGGAEGLYLWSLPEFKLLHFLPIEESENSDWVTDLAFAPDSRTLLAGYWDGYAQYWQVQE